MLLVITSLERLPALFLQFLGFFYGGFGAILTPLFGVQASYGDDMVSYNNALGFWVLMWAVFNLFFMFGSMAM